MTHRQWTTVGVVLVIAGAFIIGANTDDQVRRPGPPDGGAWADLTPTLADDDGAAAVDVDA